MFINQTYFFHIVSFMFCFSEALNSNANIKYQKPKIS